MVAAVALLFLQTGDSFLNWMDGIAQRQLSERQARVEAVRTQEQAEARKTAVRAALMQLIGGWPDYSGPLNARITGSIDAGDYTIEKVAFESLPKYWVTANLYRPKQAGRYPGILFAPGHWDQGKPIAQRIAGNLAMKGFVVLAYDPVGQGERLQAFDARKGGSLDGGSVEQHLAAGALNILTGETFSKYHIWDARRALDYLVSRPEVDAQRIGATGCSGGGTITTFISALEDRIRVAAPTCYMNSFRVLFHGPVGDAEQSLPGFLASGLDQTDFVELFAPKPWLIGSTEEDFFTPAGARIVYEEAKRWYGIYNAQDRVKWIVGPGEHGTPPPVREAIYEWMIRWLKDGQGDSHEQDVALRPDRDFQVTGSGQVATDLHSRDVSEFAADRYRNRRKATPADLAAYIRALLEREKNDAPPLRITVLKPSAPGRHPAAVLVQSTNDDKAARALTDSSKIAAIVIPQGLPAETTTALSGDWITNLRMMMIGRSLPALRAYDITRAVDQLSVSPDVDAASITVRASGVAGFWALLAAAADPRISAVELDRTPADYAAAFAGLHRDLWDTVIPGFALKWDIDDLPAAISPRRVSWTDPTDWMGHVIVRPGAAYFLFAQ